MHIKNILIGLLILCLGQVSFAAWDIKAERNAYLHNNRGLNYLDDKYYFGAIKEFQMAIDLLPNSQATAIFQTNLGKTYEKIGYPSLAKPCFERAVSLNVMSFDYYLNLVQNYKTLGIIDSKLEEYKNKKTSPLNDILIGLLYIQKGQKSTGITVLDDFCNKEPNLMITTGVKNYLKEITKE